MSHATRTRTTGLAAAFAITAVLVGTQIASAVDPVPPPDAGPTIAAGELRLHMSTDAANFRFIPTSGSTVTQGIVAKPKCEYGSNPVVPNLVNLTAGGGTVGYSSKNLQLGVNKNDGATKCTQVNPDESLTFVFENGSGTPMEGLYASFAMLDVERKFNPVLQIDAFRDEGPTPVYHEDYDCTASDCGPDRDTDGDNRYLRFPSVGSVLFDKLVISVHPSVSAGASLEGGNDLYIDSARQDTIFNMVMPGEGEICQGGTVQEPPLVENPRALVTWLGAPNPNNCKDYLLTYTRDPDTNQRELEYLIGGATGGATFKVVMAWDPEAATNPVALSTTDPAGVNGSAGTWCNGGPLPAEADPSDVFTMPEGESWCAYELTAQAAGTQMIQVSEKWLLVGDATIQRR